MKSSGSKKLLKFLAICLSVGIAHIGCTEVDTYNTVRAVGAATTPKSEKCSTCKGLGHYLLSDGETRINCPVCEGTGVKK
jgi:DnaJ-class molecular chaperone